MNPIYKKHPEAVQAARRQEYLDAMSCVGSSVNVITTDGLAGRGGVTATAMPSYRNSFYFVG